MLQCIHCSRGNRGGQGRVSASSSPCPKKTTNKPKPYLLGGPCLVKQKIWELKIRKSLFFTCCRQECWACEQRRPPSCGPMDLLQEPLPMCRSASVLSTSPPLGGDVMATVTVTLKHCGLKWRALAFSCICASGLSQQPGKPLTSMCAWSLSFTHPADGPTALPSCSQEDGAGLTCSILNKNLYLIL